MLNSGIRWTHILSNYGPVAQLVRAPGIHQGGPRFKPWPVHIFHFIPPSKSPNLSNTSLDDDILPLERTSMDQRTINVRRQKVSLHLWQWKLLTLINVTLIRLRWQKYQICQMKQLKKLMYEQVDQLKKHSGSWINFIQHLSIVARAHFGSGIVAGASVYKKLKIWNI